MNRDEIMERRKTTEEKPPMDFDERKLFDNAFGEDLDSEFQSK